MPSARSLLEESEARVAELKVTLTQQTTLLEEQERVGSKLQDAFRKSKERNATKASASARC